MTNLHRIIGYLAATLVELAMAGAFGAAPTVVLDIPTPVATRMSPCPVHAGINIASSSTGDSSSWDQCRIMWQLEADGSALDDWPSKYRYVTDPRPGLNSKQIDLAGQTNTGNYNRPRGFNFGWVLTAGTWRIKCTVTNPEGLTTTTTSSDITIAADTRTEYTVQASGGDYTTLAAALAARAATSNVKITVEDGHTENFASVFTTISGSNFVIRQAGTGTKPLLTRTGTPTGTDGWFNLTGESYIVEGIAFAESTGNVDANTYTPEAVQIRASGALVGVDTGGDESFRASQAFFVRTTTDGVLILRCSTTATENYSFAGEAGTSYENTTLVACDFGYSVDESIIRTVGNPNRVNVCWCDLNNDGVSSADKSSLRYHQGQYLHAWGNYLEDDNWLGAASEGQTPGATYIRIEGNYSDDAVAKVQYDVESLTACNNITFFIQISDPAENDPQIADEGIHYCRWLHNTIVRADGSTSDLVIGGRGTNLYHTNNRFSSNLVSHADPADLTGHHLDIGVGIATFQHNTFPATQTNLTEFCRRWNEGAIVVPALSLTSLESTYAWASDNTLADVTLDGRYEPSSPTIVSTESGVFDDYYGNPRGTTSYVGAVGVPVVKTFLPGVFIDRQ